MRVKLNQSIDKLASLYKYGALEVANNPSDFLDNVMKEVVRLREDQKDLLSICKRLLAVAFGEMGETEEPLDQEARAIIRRIEEGE
jgi:hypothetical protein